MFWPSLVVTLPFDYAQVWEMTRQSCGLKSDTLAAQMGLTATQLSQAIRGNGHVSHQRFQLLYLDPDTRPFAAALTEELHRLHYVDNVDALAAFIRDGIKLVVKGRMAKARLPEAVREEVV